MNKVVLMGRLTRDPDVRNTQGENSMAVARYTLAVDRRRSRNQQDGQPTADFISCVAFGKGAEFAQNYLHKGTKICVSGRIQTGSYTNRDGQKVYTTDVVVEDHEFAESKATQNGNASNYTAPAQSAPQSANPAPAAGNTGGGLDGFMNLPDGIDEELPFA